MNTALGTGLVTKQFLQLISAAGQAMFSNVLQSEVPLTVPMTALSVRDVRTRLMLPTVQIALHAYSAAVRRLVHEHDEHPNMVFEKGPLCKLFAYYCAVLAVTYQEKLLDRLSTGNLDLYPDLQVYAASMIETCCLRPDRNYQQAVRSLQSDDLLIAGVVPNVLLHHHVSARAELLLAYSLHRSGEWLMALLAAHHCDLVVDVKASCADGLVEPDHINDWAHGLKPAYQTERTP